MFDKAVWRLLHDVVARRKRLRINEIARELAPHRRVFLGRWRSSRTAREFSCEQDFSDLDAVCGYLRHWARKVKLDPKPAPPPGVIRRFDDNVRGLLAIADSCGPEWGQRAREANLFSLEKEQAERPQITMVRHGLAIFDALGSSNLCRSACCSAYVLLLTFHGKFRLV
jgi:Protein of unknown function (DUF3631)